MKTVEQYTDELIKKPLSIGLSGLDNADNALEEFVKERPTELEDFKKHIFAIEDCRNRLKEYILTVSIDSIANDIIEECTDLKLNWEEGITSDVETIFDKMEKLKSSIELENKKHNEELKHISQMDNAVYQGLEDKRLVLASYSDKIFDLCGEYGITTSDVEIDNSTFSIEQLNNLYSKYISYMEKEEKENVIVNLRNSTSKYVQILILGVLLILCFTPLLDILSLIFFCFLGIRQFKNKNKVKYYSVLMGITFNINPLNMGYARLDESLLLPEELTDEMIDSDERFSEFESQIEKIESKYEKIDPEKEQARLLQEFESNKAIFNKLINDAQHAFTSKKENILEDYEAEIKEVNILYQDLLSRHKKLGNRFSSRLVFDTNFTLGLHDDVIEEKVELGLQNVIIRSNRNDDLMNLFIRTMLINAFSNVFPGKLTVHIYDPNNFGRQLMPLFKKDLERIFIFHKEELGKLISSLTDYVQDNFKDMGGQTIQDYNLECEEFGKTPKEYKLLVILSQPKLVEEEEALNAFFKYSATGGVFIWAVSDKMAPRDAKIFKRPFEGVDNPILDFEDKACSKFAERFMDEVSKATLPALIWQDFVDIVIPENKIWTGNADEFIELYPGFLNGDPTSYKPYTVGNVGNVHILGVGGTGAGKSVFLNHLISTICRYYPPDAVELWLCDFKGTEFKFYLSSEEYPYMLPHIKACLCTSDGDYATSLFKTIRNMADARYETLKEYGQKNMLGFNKFCREKYEETGDINWKKKIWPRVLFICDEFQVIFTKADSKNLDSINGDITQLAKVARAAGVHIFFTSQSMKKTISADILQQFTLRFALRCDPEVSMDILGTNKASDIKEKNGYLITRSVEMTLDEQKRYRTPYLHDEDKPGKPSKLRNHVKLIYDRAVKENFTFRDVITYEEATKHPIEELKDWYKKDEVKGKIPASGVFLMGMRMEYSENKAPTNIVLTTKNNTHIMSVFRDMTDLVNFFNMCMWNILSNEVVGNIIINSQVSDLAYLTDAESFISMDNYKDKLSEKITPREIIEWVTKLYEYRKNTNNKETPVYIVLLGWDKGPNIGVDPDATLRVKLANLLQVCGEFNIHFIFINTGIGGINTTIIDACSYRVAGKCEENDSMAICNSRRAATVYESMKNGYIFLFNSGKLTRSKLYMSEITREIVSNEIVL